VLGPGYYLNVTKRRELVIRIGPSEADAVGIIVEVKKATDAKGHVNRDMVTPTDFNRKAFHEMLLYYLEDHEDKSGNDLRRLVITSGIEWFIFDAQDFRRFFWDNNELLKSFRSWAAKIKANDRIKFFYNDIAKNFLAKIDEVLPFTYVDLRQEAIAETGLINRSKLFQAPHLLKVPFAQDANTLNRAFYEELLYVIGL
jgi:adenine-specific DNA-methyltransferase